MVRVIRENCRYWLGRSNSEPTFPLPRNDLSEKQIAALYDYLDRLLAHKRHDIRSTEKAEENGDALSVLQAERRIAKRAASRASQARRWQKARKS